MSTGNTYGVVVHNSGSTNRSHSVNSAYSHTTVQTQTTSDTSSYAPSDQGWETWRDPNARKTCPLNSPFP